MTFADAIVRANSSVLKHLTNVTAVLDTVPVTGIYRNAYAQVLDGMATAAPDFLMQTQQAVHAKQGSRLRVLGGAEYRVSSAEPDGTGLTRLVLERL